MFLLVKLKYHRIFLWSLVIMSIFIFTNFERPDIIVETRIPVYLCKNSNLSSGPITPLEDKRTFIISSYYDAREADNKVVRVLSILHFREVRTLYCWFCCQTNPYMQISKARLDKHGHRYDFSYVTTDVLCKEPPGCNARRLSVHTSSSGDVSKLPFFPIRNQNREQFTANFTVCISNMFGNFSNILQFIQTMEMYKILGAQRVMIYLTDCSPLMEKVMQYYVRRGILEIIPWPIESYFRTGKTWHYSMDPKDIGYYGQMATLNDCIYRNMYRSRFVVLNDIDEIILPFEHLTWNSMMEELQRENPEVGVFRFYEYTFRYTVFTAGNFAATSSWKNVPGRDILQHIHREPAILLFFNNQKMIVDPRKVIQTSVHLTLKHYGSKMNVPERTAIVHHCRGPRLLGLQKTFLIEEKTIWKFNGSLITNVNQVLKEIPLL